MVGTLVNIISNPYMIVGVYIFTITLMTIHPSKEK